MYTYGHVSSRGCPDFFNLGCFLKVSGTPLFDTTCKYIRLHLLYDKVGLEDKADKSRQDRKSNSKLVQKGLDTLLQQLLLKLMTLFFAWSP